MRKDSYVYIHRRKDNNCIFYVGVGSDFKGNRSKARSRSLTGRTLTWKNIVKSAGGFNVEIVEDSVTKEQAIELEGFIMSFYTMGELANIAKSSKTRPVDYELLNEYLYYSESSSTYIRWKVDRSRKTKAGDIAGYKHGKYFAVELKGRSYLAHRVVWVLCNKDRNLGDFVINHRDCNGFNNNIENLEKCSTQENNSRQAAHVLNRPRINNTTGVTGVSKITTPDGHEYLAALWNENGVRKSKTFSIKTYGYSEALRLATDWRNSVIMSLEQNSEQLPELLKSNYTKKIESGLPKGVRQVLDKNKKLSHYIAVIKVNKKEMKRSYFVSKYGKEEAFRLACEWRKQMQELHHK